AKLTHSWSRTATLRLPRWKLTWKPFARHSSDRNHICWNSGTEKSEVKMSQWQKFVTQLTQATQEIVASIAQFLPRLMVMLLIVPVGWLIAYALKSILRSILHLARFDKLSQHAGASQLLRKASLPSHTQLLGRSIVGV